MKREREREEVRKHNNLQERRMYLVGLMEVEKIASRDGRW